MAVRMIRSTSGVSHARMMPMVIAPYAGCPCLTPGLGALLVNVGSSMSSPPWLVRLPAGAYSVAVSETCRGSNRCFCQRVARCPYATSVDVTSHPSVSPGPPTRRCSGHRTARACDRRIAEVHVHGRWITGGIPWLPVRAVQRAADGWWPLSLRPWVVGSMVCGLWGRGLGLFVVRAGL